MVVVVVRVGADEWRGIGSGLGRLSDTWPNGEREPLIRTPTRIKSFLNFKVDTSMVDYFSKIGLPIPEVNNFMPMVMLLKSNDTLLNMEGNHREGQDLDELINYILEPKSGAPWFPVTEFTEAAMEFRWGCLKRAQTYLKTIRWRLCSILA